MGLLCLSAGSTAWPLLHLLTPLLVMKHWIVILVCLYPIVAGVKAKNVSREDRLGQILASVRHGFSTIVQINLNASTQRVTPVWTTQIVAGVRRTITVYLAMRLSLLMVIVRRRRTTTQRALVARHNLPTM